MHPFLRQRVTRPQSMHISFLGRLDLFRTIQSGPRISQTKETFPFEWWNIAISSMKVIGWSSIIFIPVAMVFKLPHPLLDIEKYGFGKEFSSPSSNPPSPPASSSKSRPQPP